MKHDNYLDNYRFTDGIESTTIDPVAAYSPAQTLDLAIARVSHTILLSQRPYFISGTQPSERNSLTTLAA